MYTGVTPPWLPLGLVGTREGLADGAVEGRMPELLAGREVTGREVAGVGMIIGVVVGWVGVQGNVEVTVVVEVDLAGVDLTGETPEPLAGTVPEGEPVVPVLVGRVRVTVVGVDAQWVQTVTVLVQPSGGGVVCAGTPVG